MFRVVDAHFDLGGIVHQKKREGYSGILDQFLLEDMKRGHVSLVIAAIFVENNCLDDPLKDALLQIQSVKEAIVESMDFMLIVDKKSFECWQASSCIGIILSLEGAEPILKALHLLDIFYDLGVRGLGLTWSRRNQVADGSYFNAPREGIQGGLTPFGIEVVEHAERLGFFLDVSHLNDAGFEDMMTYSTKPFIASHSNARSLCGIPRNLTNKQIQWIQKRSGVIGTNGYKQIVGIENQSLSKFCDHIEYMMDIGDSSCVGLGLDRCNMYYHDGKAHDVISAYEDLELVWKELIARGHDAHVIEKVFYRNFVEFFSNHFGTRNGCDDDV